MSLQPGALRRWLRDEEGRLRVALRLTVHTLVVLVGYALGWLWMWATGGGWSLATGVAIQATWVVLATWLFSRKLDRRTPASRGFRGEHALRDGLAGALLGVALIGTAALVEGLLGWATYEPVALTPEAALAIARAAVIFVCVAVAEESWFRGYQLSNIAEASARWGPLRAKVVALFVSSFFFGCAHILNPHATLLSTTNIIVGGLLLGITFAQTRRLAFPIGLHFTWNLMQALLDMPVSGQELVSDLLVRRTERGDDVWTGGAFGPEAGLLGLLLMLVGTLGGGLYAQRVERPVRREVDTEAPLCDPPRDDLLVDDRSNLGRDPTDA